MSVLNLMFLCLVGVLGQTITPGPAIPIEPISAILDAFNTHQIVALPDAHRSEQIHRFTLALIRDPRFARTVDDIVVEFGNALHQDIIDRFVQGDEVPDESLRRIWMDTTQSHPGLDTPQPEEFFRAVRGTDVLVAPSLCADATYIEMRSRRMALTEWRSDQLKNYCATPLK